MAKTTSFKPISTFSIPDGEEFEEVTSGGIYVQDLIAHIKSRQSLIEAGVRGIFFGILLADPKYDFSAIQDEWYSWDDKTDLNFFTTDYEEEGIKELEVIAYPVRNGRTITTAGHVSIYHGYI
jgi:hypothetical protein